MSSISEAKLLDRFLASAARRFFVFRFPEPRPLALVGPASLLPLALAEAVWLLAGFLALLLAEAAGGGAFLTAGGGDFLPPLAEFLAEFLALLAGCLLF